MGIAKVSAGRGSAWIQESIKLVTDRPAVWIGGTAVVLGLTLVLDMIPLVGGLLNQIIQFAVLVLAFSFAHAQAQSAEFNLDETLKLVRSRLLRLFLMVVVCSILFAICALPVIGALVSAGGMSFLMAQQSSLPEMSFTATLVVAFGGLISAAAATVALAATSFTIPLILFQNQSISQAMRLSLQAVKTNLAAFVVFTFLISLLLLVCAIPFGLGLLFGLPTAMASVYVIYKELLGQAGTL